MLRKSATVLAIAALAIILAPGHSYAQSDTLWTRSYGGTGDDWGWCVQQTTDGGFITAGWTESFGAGGKDIWLIKTDAWGDTLWAKTYGGTGDEEGRSVEPTTDGGYIITGWTESFGPGSRNMWLIKTDANGDTLWTRTYSGLSGGLGYSVRQTSDGGYIIVGTVWSSFGGGGYDPRDLWLVRTDANGDTSWTRSFGTNEGDYGYSVQQTIDEGFIVVGNTWGIVGSQSHVYLIKTDSLGNQDWAKTYAGGGRSNGASVQLAPDSGYIISGVTNVSSAGGFDVYLLKTDSLGNYDWSKTYGGAADDETDGSSSLQPTSDGGYVVTGWTKSFGAGGSDVWLLKTDANGDTVWTTILGGTGDDEGYSGQQTADGGYIIAGYTASFGAGGKDIFLIRRGYREVLLTEGQDVSGAARTDVVVKFFIQNTGQFPDVYDVSVTDSLGWNIDPLYYEVTLDTTEVDSVYFTVSIPNVVLGTTNRIFATAVSQAIPSVLDSASLTVTCDAYNVDIADVSDVGNDQGQQVRTEWTSFPGSDPSVTDFTIFRRIDPLLFALPAHNPRFFSGKDYPPGEWDMIGTYEAFGETLYSAVVPTLKDSTIAEGMYWSVFFVRAGTDDPIVYFDSPVDSGYSLDNLSPSPPAGLFAFHEPAVTKLTWSMIPDVDFDYYTIYRDTLSGFTPGPNNRLGYAIDTSFVDSTAELGRTYYYLASTTDFSGNESDPSNEAMAVRYNAGDANADGIINVGDVVYLVSYLYRNGPAPSPVEAGDCNCDDIVNVGDVVYLVAYLYRGGDPPGC